MLSHAKYLIPNIFGQHLDNSELNKYSNLYVYKFF